MSRKRRNSSSSDFEHPEPKRCPSSSSPKGLEGDGQFTQKHVRPQMNQETGQTDAFPGLGSDEDELFYGPAADGIDYLRMVRSERKGIPHVLTFQETIVHSETSIGPPLQDTDVNLKNAGMEGGFWDDGAYTARPDTSCSTASRFPPAQTLYYDSLLVHFNLIRATMKCLPPLTRVEHLSSSQPISFPRESTAARRAWEDQLQRFDPSSVQIACMDDDSALELLKLVRRRIFVFFRTSDATKVERLGAWLWAILGKLPDRGQLGSEEIGDLRQLAKRAKAVMLKYEDEAQDDGFSDDDKDDDSIIMDGGNDEYYDAERQSNPLSQSGDVADVLKADKSTLTNLLGQNSITDGCTSISHGQDNIADSLGSDSSGRLREKKIIILDMLITIVGEMYGQLDLLDSRTPWQASEHA